MFFSYQDRNDAFGIFRLMWSEHEDTRWDWHAIEGLFVKAFIEAYQLSDESHIGVCNRTPLFYVAKPLVKCHALLVNQICEAHCGTARDPLNAVHINFAVCGSSILDEIDRIVEYALDLFTDMVL